MKCLVTGASSGLGKDMAKILSKKGYEVILVSKDEEKLIKVCEQIKNSSYYVCDLSKEKEVDKLLKFILKEKPEIVINNAGFGAFGDYREVSLEREMEMVNVNVIALHKITKTCLTYMGEFKESHLLNVASIAGLLPGGPLLNTYYATKNYVRAYTLGIYEEVRKNKEGINIHVLCPGPVDTNFNRVAGGNFSIGSHTSEFVSSYAIEKMFQNKLVIIPGFRVQLMDFLNRFSPRKLILRILYKIEHKKRK